MIFTARLFGCGQRLAINFAVWRKRHRIQQHEMCREHVFRQFVLEPEAEIWNQISKQSAAQRICGVGVRRAHCLTFAGEMHQANRALSAEQDVECAIDCCLRRPNFCGVPALFSNGP